MNTQTKKAQKRDKPGKPAFFDVPMKRHNVMLDAETVAELLSLGDGNLSAGIRKAVEIIQGKPTKREYYEALGFTFI